MQPSVLAQLVAVYDNNQDRETRRKLRRYLDREMPDTPLGDALNKGRKILWDRENYPELEELRHSIRLIKQRRAAIRRTQGREARKSLR